jgi:hypothetical protein
MNYRNAQRIQYLRKLENDGKIGEVDMRRLINMVETGHDDDDVNAELYASLLRMRAEYLLFRYNEKRRARNADAV